MGEEHLHIRGRGEEGRGGARAPEAGGGVNEVSLKYLPILHRPGAQALQLAGSVRLPSSGLAYPGASEDRRHSTNIVKLMSLQTHYSRDPLTPVSPGLRFAGASCARGMVACARAGHSISPSAVHSVRIPSIHGPVAFGSHQLVPV